MKKKICIRVFKVLHRLFGKAVDTAVFDYFGDAFDEYLQDYAMDYALENPPERSR